MLDVHQRYPERGTQTGEFCENLVHDQTDPVVTCPTAVPPPLASDSFHVITQEEVKSKRKK
uniref:Uncharacterized protein n=1 Tax=Magallana gigas TaxID=29159 RepID=K1QIC5_MAGGI